MLLIVIHNYNVSCFLFVVKVSCFLFVVKVS